MFSKTKMAATGLGLTVAVFMSGAGLAQESEPGARPWNPEVGHAIAEQGNQAIRNIRNEARQLQMPDFPGASELVAAQPASDAVAVASVPEHKQRLRLAH